MFEEATIRAIETLPNGFNDPKYLAAGALVIAGGVAFDQLKQKKEQQLASEALPIADPETAEYAQINNRRSRLVERVSYYSAVAFASLACFQLADPYQSNPHEKGGASFVINADNTSDTVDMAEGNHQVSRLSASIDGSIAAAKTNAVPMVFELAGDIPKLADTVNSNSSDINHTKARIDSLLNYSFQNGNSLGEAVDNVLTVQGNLPNDIIIEASAMNSTSQSEIEQAKADIKVNYPNDSIYAVVVGNSNPTQQIGAEVLSSPVDLSSFQETLGRNNVYSATDANQVETAIDSILSSNHVDEGESPIELMSLDLATVVAGLLAALAVKRRLSGVFKSTKRDNTESK